ncbi:AtzH-like domain-containing protein [Frondihabitans sp. 4ASC-45]|uniref:AtzH-like domain-containing protein n=1 Tax=Frondihabitans sp. 4ASC-45 TaxID=3111636 RepID=UPI003C28AC6F
MTTITSLQGELPDGLIPAFDAYETALKSNDQQALGEAFEPGAETLRADGGGLLVGHDAISAFRGRRSQAPQREIVQVHVRVIDADTAVIVSVNAPKAGGRGVVTQLWRRSAAGADAVGAGAPAGAPADTATDDGTGVWRIATAQVQAPTPVFDTRIWRVVGAPLIETTADPSSPPGPLAGETVAVKDLFAVAGVRIGAGVPAYLDEQVDSEFHSPAVQVLLDAGASVLGIAQTDEFAYSIAGRNSSYGTPPNAVVPGAISGGSSSGPASAVALGHASIGLGTDTGGSIRVPASYQGLWGLRTTHNAIRRTDLLPLAPTFDTVGWLTRDADLLARVASASFESVAARSSAVQREVDPSFVVDRRLSASVSPDVRDAFGSLVDALPAAGFEAPAEVALGDIAHLYELFRIVQAAEAWASHGDWITGHPGSLAPDVEARFLFGRSVDAAHEADARAELAAQRDHLDRVLDGRILLLPSASSSAPLLSSTPAEIDVVRSQTLGLTCIAGVGGYPAVSAPLMTVPGGPVGLCLVGPRRTDLALIGIASSLEVALRS